MLWPTLLAAACMVALSQPAAAGEGVDAPVLPRDIVQRATSFADDLVLPDRAEAIAALTAPRMALLKPPGSGPFPALVLLHQCAGLNGAVAAWARRAVARNYAVLLLDAFGARGVTSVCYGPKAGVNLVRGAKDAVQAAQHLRRQPFVDSNRVALVGFSWGGMVGLLAARRHYLDAFGAGPGFAAVASFYPGCFRIRPPGGRDYELIGPDVAQPLLLLMGDADTETPAAECVDKLTPVKAAGAPVEWHVYLGTTHCWDCQQLDGRTKTDVRGNHVAYRYQPSAVENSERQLFEFLQRSLAGKFH
jgi:dienelactone hydrolase